MSVGCGIAFEDLFRNHDHAGRAEAALEGVLVPEGFLHGVQFAVGGGEAFDGEDLRAIGLDGEHAAALDGLAVDFDGAGAAEGGFAAHVRAGEPDDFAEVVDQQEARLHFVSVAVAVDGHGDGSLHAHRPRQSIHREPCSAGGCDLLSTCISCSAGRAGRIASWSPGKDHAGKQPDLRRYRRQTLHHIFLRAGRCEALSLSAARASGIAVTRAFPDGESGGRIDRSSASALHVVRAPVGERARLLEQRILLRKATRRWRARWVTFS